MAVRNQHASRFFFVNRSEAIASSASSEGRTYNLSNRRPNVYHSTFESLRLGLSSQSIVSGFLCLWDSLNFKKDREFVGITVLFLDGKVNSVIHGFTLVGRANHYMPSLKADSIVKVDCFEVARTPHSKRNNRWANFSGSSSTSRQNQKIDVGGRLIKGILQRTETA
uniref:Uncharacterized protein n=1 Tax=Brassica oleracea TaxID=3712 RepID=Q25BM7_BRAOL|nr:hypothetical protein 23.t00001 [Brassica oleracea]